MLRLRILSFFALLTMAILCLVLSFATANRLLSERIARKSHITMKIAEHLKNENDNMEDETAETISRTIYQESARYSIDYRLILALMKIESNFRHEVVSSRGARGLLQIKPYFAKFIAHDLGIKWDGSKTLDQPDKNIKIGVHFLSRLITDFRHIDVALKAYNTGPTKVRESLHENTKPLKGFPALVLAEYKRNTAFLPNP